ncbi:histidine decarboxylase [Butyrivibrio sp. ob235]|uniref:pyridoxal-dependent decarboxylase n=1 Tax=Butyrivibrio sp. ob235 TaxID=1761780 RepID=UPI0008CDE1F9|nr:pyridoxal-dependent decarboxylase [Butyrivibrio sp. ob235]SEL18876.1 histidine decarboxylase [Butyrivibrio sp. ob235]
MTNSENNNVLNNAENEDPCVARLDEYAGTLFAKKNRAFGYPINHKSRLVQFYKWLSGSGLNLAMANNAGDPFNIHDGLLNTLVFEREVIEMMGPLYGFDLGDTWGIVTFSGTDGNNHGIYFGTNYIVKKTKQRPILYVSDAAHYSSMRLANLQNLELKLIPSDIHGCMIPEEFEKALVPDKPALVVFAMGTTFKGGVDDQAAINAILAKHPEIPVYRHVDAALFGGYLPYTRFKDVVNRNVQPFDSIAISGHKFFGIDEPAGVFLTSMEVKNNQIPFEISYLNASMPMINCSRSAMSPLKLWWILKHTTKEDFTEQSEGMLERAQWLKGALDEIGWPAWLEPMSNTVYFKRPVEEIADRYGLAPDHDDRLGGDLSHIVVMQHVTKDRLQVFVDAVKDSIG